MKISVNDQELYTLTPTQLQVLGDAINANLEEDLKRRLKWVLTHKFEEVMKDMKSEWIPKLQANGVTMMPIDNEEFAKLVFSQPNYKQRSKKQD
jgi:plasmid maintenance system killer protein